MIRHCAAVFSLAKVLIFITTYRVVEHASGNLPTSVSYCSQSAPSPYRCHVDDPMALEAFFRCSLGRHLCLQALNI